MQLSPAVVVEHGPAGGCRGVDGELATHRRLRSGPVAAVRAGRGQHGQAHREPVERSAARVAQRGQGDLAEVGGAGEGVAEQPVARAAGHLRHARPDRGDQHGRVAVRVRARVEELRHQTVAVELAVEPQPLAGGPARPDRTDGADELLHPLRGPAPRHAEPALDVGPHLGAEAELEAPSGDELPLVPRHCDRHRVAGERDGDPALQRDPLRGPGGQRRADEHVVPGLGQPDAVVSGRLGVDRRGLDPHGIGLDVGDRVDPHGQPDTSAGCSCPA